MELPSASIIVLGVGIAVLIIGIILYFIFGKKKPVDINKAVKTTDKPSEEEKLLFEIKNVEIPSLPEIKESKNINIRYPLIPPYAYAHVQWDSKNNELVYNIEEPVLNENEQNILKTLEKGIGELINLSYISSKDKYTVLSYLEKNIKVLLTELSIKISMDTFMKVMYYIYRDFVGLNEIEPMMNDYFIEDIECNGVNTPIYIVHRKYRNIRTNLIYKDMHIMTSFVEKLAQKCGRYISYAEPLLDASLPDGSRVNSTYTTDITSRGPTFSIRKFTKEPWSPLQLIQKGTLTSEILAYAWMCVEYELSFMVIGGTGSGKTSLINALAFFIPPQARVVSIEDTREITLYHENWLPSVARAGVGLTNILGQRYGEVTLFDLLKASFRQRPDYIIVGEVRGKEAYILFQAFASGHPGCATMHAEDVGTMIRRLETQPINLSGSLLMTLSSVFVIEQTKVKGKDVRKVSSIDEIVDVKEHLKGFTTNNVFKWDPAAGVFKFNPNSLVFNKIATHYGFTKENVFKEYQLRAKLLRNLYNRGIIGFKDVQDIVNQYYKTPQDVLKRYGVI